MAAARNGRLERVAENIYRRNGVYIVSMSDGQGGKFWQGGIAEFEEAKNVRAGFQRQKRRRKGRVAPETIEQFAARWMIDFPRNAESTRIHNAQQVAHFAKTYGQLRLSEFSGDMAAQYAVKHPTSASRVRTMFEDARRSRADGLRENPFEGISIPKSTGRSEITVLTPQELDTLKAIARELSGPEWGPIHAALIDLAAWTGMRPGELFALAWEDIDFDSKVIHVQWARNDRTGKMGPPKPTKRHPEGNPRTIALTAPAEKALRDLERMGAPRPVAVRGGHAAELVLSSKRGKPMTHRNHQWYWDVVRKAFYQQLPAGRKAQVGADLDFYELRHFAASYLANLGASPYDIAQHMGHSDNGRTAMRVYIHVGEAASRDRIRRLFNQEPPDDERREASG